MSTSLDKTEQQLLAWFKSSTSEQKHFEPKRKNKTPSKKKKRDIKLATKGIVREFEATTTAPEYPKEMPTKRGVMHYIPDLKES